MSVNDVESYHVSAKKTMPELWGWNFSGGRDQNFTEISIPLTCVVGYCIFIVPRYEQPTFEGFHDGKI